MAILMCSSSAFAGKEGGNGGGSAEKNILFAKESLPRFIDLCLSAKSACGISVGREEDLLKAIRDDLAVGRETGGFHFASEAEHPGMFMLDGKVRVARTGDDVGNPVAVNTDLIYTLDAQGHYVAMDIPMAVSVLVHEYGHHHRIKDCEFLDRLGTKVQAMLRSHVQQIGWSADPISLEDVVGAIGVQYRRFDAFDQILAFDSESLTNLSSLLTAQLSCDPSGKARYKGLQITNLHWGWWENSNPNTNLVTMPLRFWVATFCDGTPTMTTPEGPIDMARVGQVTMTLSFEMTSLTQMRFLPDRTQVDFVDCLAQPGQCR
jgi:hypothetical protein